MSLRWRPGLAMLALVVGVAGASRADSGREALETGTWLQVTPRLGGGPGEPNWSAVTYDGKRGRLVLFGFGEGYNHTVWSFDSGRGAYTVLLPHGMPNHPNGRNNNAIAYDDTNDGVWAVGGTGSGGFWFYDAAANRIRSYNHLWQVTEGCCLNPGLVYDSAHKALVMYGGYLNGGPSNETWVFDVAAKRWKRITTRPAPPPTEAADHKMVFDGKRGRILLFVRRQTWALAVPTGRWQQIATTGTPAIGAVAYDSRRDVVVAFGGWRGNGLSNEAWMLDLTTNAWTPLTRPGPPAAPRDDHQVELVYDIARDAFVLLKSPQSAGLDLLDTWLYRPAGSAPTAGPADRAVLSGLRAENVTATSAEVRFEASTGVRPTVEFGASTAYGRTVVPDERPWYRGRPFWRVAGWAAELKLTHLEPATTYHYRVRAVDVDGQHVVSEDRTFTTAPARDRFIDFTHDVGYADPGWEPDTGAPYDPRRGFGWDRPITGRAAVGPGYVRRYASGLTSGGGEAATWTLDLPNGTYLVSLAAGNTAHNTGPHVHGPQRVQINGSTVVDDVKVESNHFAEVHDRRVDVTDGRLRVTIGGARGTTTINWIAVRSVSAGSAAPGPRS